MISFGDENKACRGNKVKKGMRASVLFGAGSQDNSNKWTFKKTI